MTITAKIHQTDRDVMTVGLYGDHDQALQNVFFGHNPNEDETTRQIKLAMAIATRIVMNMELAIQGQAEITTSKGGSSHSYRRAVKMTQRAIDKIQEASMLAVGARWRALDDGAKDPFDKRQWRAVDESQE